MNTMLFWKSRIPEDPREHFTGHADVYWGVTADSEGNHGGVFVFVFVSLLRFYSFM